VKNNLRSLFASLFFGIVALPCAVTAQSQNPANKANLLPRDASAKQPPASVQLRMEKFFLSIQNKQIQEAYTTLLSDSQLESKEEQVKELITKTSNVLAEIGPVTYWEIYDNRTAGSRMISLIYFSYQDKKPLRWRFIFYASTPDQWRVINLSVDDLVAESFLTGA